MALSRLEDRFYTPHPLPGSVDAPRTAPRYAGRSQPASLKAARTRPVRQPSTYRGGNGEQKTWKEERHFDQAVDPTAAFLWMCCLALEGCARCVMPPWHRSRAAVGGCASISVHGALLTVAEDRGQWRPSMETIVLLWDAKDGYEVRPTGVCGSQRGRSMSGATMPLLRMALGQVPSEVRGPTKCILISVCDDYIPMTAGAVESVHSMPIPENH
ncbi:hypothetical protein PCL_04993 [Purpureocillium lilacinum]|uniref:Uncharacterized protein n=1 Tax=Purpureocillium lilacinum TaxID=33203 RepID=A0A2U3DWF0_PURLI|nr:hypothetical protein Purlil1_10426 [Purpureocillium lilacinum]PWI66580.1 hypothetical protein PCL_04993 [Purpureocillium lilacinum]